MAGTVATFKALSLDEMIEAYPQITALLAAAKDARRLQLVAEIKALGFSRAKARDHPRPQSSIAASATRPRLGRAAVPKLPG